MFDFAAIQEALPQITEYEVIPLEIKRSALLGHEDDAFRVVPLWLLFFVGNDGYYIMPENVTDTQDIIDCLKTVMNVVG